MQAATAPGTSAGLETELSGTPAGIEIEPGATPAGIEIEPRPTPAGLEIELNGAPHRVASGAHLQDLIDALELAGQALALAVNRQVVPRQQWATRSLAAGDKVDIVRAIGGG